MGRQSSKSKVSKKQIDEAAELAAEEALADVEEETSFEDDGDETVSFNFQQNDLATDVFEEGFKKAMTLRDSPRFHIKKNSQFLTVKDYPYSWEQLQKEYGPGYYQVQCKARSNGRILKSQTEMVGDPNDGREVESEETDTQTATQDNNLAVLGWLQQSQERAEARARETARSQESALATVMQTVMTAQQESTKTMMQIMMESSKQNQALILAMMQNNQAPKGPDPVVTLLTTLLTKEKPKEGMGWAEVMKLMKDAERDAENRTKNMYDMIEKKSEALAEIKAEAMSGGEGEGEESLTKTLIKGFVPVLSQMVAQGPQGVQQRIQEQRQIEGATAALDEGFLERQALRPGISGPNVPRPQPRQAPNRNVSTQVTVAQPAPVTGPQVVDAKPEDAPSPQESRLDSRQKEMIFNFCAPDIGQAMMTGTPASKAAAEVIVKLEKEGISRQTVANGFELEDFFGFAEKYIPAEQMAPAKVWLKEFYEAIKKVATVRPEGPKLARPSNGANGHATPGTVATKRSGPSPRGTRVQPRDNPKNI